MSNLDVQYPHLSAGMKEELTQIEAEAASSVERLADNWIEVSLKEVKQGIPSECAKELQDMVLQIAVIIALRKTSMATIDKATGISFVGWNELAAANALGMTHKALQSAIKRFAIQAPKPDSIQADLFKDIA